MSNVFHISTPRDVAPTPHPDTPPNEQTTLLPNPTTKPAQGDERPSKNPTFPTQAKLIANEFRILLSTSIPVILAYTLQNSLQTVSVLVVGRLSPSALGTAAFAYMFAMATGWLIALGGTTAIDTLASASFTGSKEPHDLGVILQRAFVVLGVFYVPVVGVWFASEPLFRALGQEAGLARDASRFLMVLAPGGLGYIYFECMKKYLQAQGGFCFLSGCAIGARCLTWGLSGIMRPGTYVLLITSPLNGLLNWLFVYRFGIGLLGAPLATGISYWSSFILLVLYSRFVAGSDCWGGWSRKCLSNLRTFTRLAILGFVHIGNSSQKKTTAQSPES